MQSIIEIHFFEVIAINEQKEVALFFFELLRNCNIEWDFMKFYWKQSALTSV